MTETAPPTGSPSESLPTILLALTLIIVLGSSLLDLHRANDSLTKLDKEQTTSMVTANRPEAQLNALARGVQQLADGGNANAAAIVATLQANGVHINPNAGDQGGGKTDSK